MKKSILKTMSLLLCTAMMAIIMLPQAAFAATDYTCYIGSNGYSTLAEAVEAANAGDTIWMTANDSTTTNITVDKSVIIELEGYTLQNAMFTFTGDIDVALNDRKGEAKINTNHNSGNTIAVKNGASLTISGENYGTEIYGSENDSDKTIYVYANSHLTLNGGSVLFAGEYMQDGIFLASKATLTINDCYVGRYNESNINGGSLSLTSTPSEDYPVIIKKGRFKAGMWLGGTTSLSTIEEKVLATSEGSYIDYDKTVDGSSTKQWDIYIASNTLSTDTEVENIVDAQNTLRVTTGGDISVKAGDSIVFEPRVSGGTQDEFTYTWTKDGADTGVTTDAFVIEATTSDDAGEYVFTATQGNNSVSCTYVLSVQAENHSHHNISFDKWSEMTDLPTMSGNYYLENEVTLSAIWTVPQGVTNLCINGRVIDLNSYYINVPAGAALNIYTCEDLKQYYDVSDNLWIPVGGFTDENKERYTSGGVITGGSNSAIFVNGGSLTLNGGAIAGNTGNAGGVTLMNGATFTMNGGDIVGNSSKGDAGGVMNNNSTFTMNGGRIHNNYAANNGGGVFNVYENALFTMNGGKIYDNISSVGAGGIGNYEDAEMIVTGGSICGNSTTWGGGGIFNYHSTLTLMGGVIDNNSSTWGGGAVFNEGILHISGAPVIKDNFVNETPNNIYLLYPEFPIVVDGPISSGPIPVSVYPDEGQLDDDFKFTESTDVSLNDASDFEYEYEGYRVEKKNDGQLYIVAYEEPKYEAENGGSVDVQENEDDGTVTLYVSVPDGFSFVGWHDGTKIISTDNPYTFVPEAGKTYTAKLEEIQPDPVNKYTITANATDGGVAEGTATVEEGQSVTLTATANEGYKFIGWFDGDTKVCETEEFTVENVTSDKTYTAKFELLETEEPDEPIEPSAFDFDSIRTGNGQNISVDHENRKISVDVEEGDNLVLYVHQKDIIPGGQIRMNSYNGYKVKYDASGVYRIYTIDDTSVTVSAKVTIDGVTEIYDLQVNYKELNSEFDFEKISCENGETFEIDHDARTIRIYAEKDAEYVTLYKDQSEFVNGKLILTSFMGNRVQSNQADGTYKVCFVKNKEVSVKGNISIGGVTKEYTIISVFSLDWGFDSLKAENATITAIDHTAKTVTMKASDSSVQLFIDQTDLKGNAQVWMKSYNGNKVKYNANDRTYTITQGTSESLTVSIKVTIYGETRYYDLILNF